MSVSIIEKAEQILLQSTDLSIAYIREDGYPRVSTISVLRSDGLKRIYMSSSINALKTKRLQANAKVSLCLHSGGNNITLTGMLSVSQEDSLRESLWQPWCINHFPDGALGELFCIFIFEAQEATFWIDGEGAEVLL